MIDSKLCKHLCCETVLLNNILKYVLNLNIDFMIETQHVQKQNLKLKQC